MSDPGRARLFRPVRLDQPTHGSITSRGLFGLAGVASQGLLRFITNAFVGHLAGSVALGVVQSAISLGTMLTLLWPTSAGGTASKYLALARGAEDSDQTQAVARHLSRRTIQSTTLLSTLAIPAWYFFHRSSIVDSFLLAMWVAGFATYSYTRGVLFGVGQVRRATYWDVGTASVGVLALLVALFWDLRGLWLLAPMALSYWLYGLAGWPHGADGEISRELRREIDRFVTIGMLGTFASSGFIQFSVLAATRAGSKEDAGYYAAALTLATPVSLLAAALSLVLFPTMAETWGRGDRAAFRQQTDVATRSLVFVMVAILGVAALLSKVLVGVVWPPAFAAAGPLLTVLLGAVLMTTISVGAVNSLNTSENRGIVITSGSSLAGMALGLAAWFLLAPRLGVMGVALGYLIGTTVVGGIPLLTVWVSVRHRWTMLAVRFMAALMAVGAGLWWSSDRSTSAQMATAAIFLGAWTLLSWRDVRLVLKLAQLRLPGWRP